MTDQPRARAREVLLANQAFYRAFADRDVAAMDTLWARDVLVACIHPGWNAIRGRAMVIASWRSILASESAPDVMCGNASVHFLGESAFVICEEQVADDVLIATNVFVREAGTWKLAHHHAAPIAQESFQLVPADEAIGEGDDSSSLN
jgi:ketosteroid isomerase-like protein